MSGGNHRIEVSIPQRAPAAHLHEILQVVMGWTDSHPHQFLVGHMDDGVPGPEWGNEVKNEKRIRLGQIVTAVKGRFVYEYDFCDS